MVPRTISATTRSAPEPVISPRERSGTSHAPSLSRAKASKSKGKTRASHKLEMFSDDKHYGRPRSEGGKEKMIDAELLAMFPDLANDVGENAAIARIPNTKTKRVSKNGGSIHIPSNPLAVRQAPSLPKNERKRPRLTLDGRSVNVMEID